MGQSNEVGSIPYERINNVEYSLFQTQGRIKRKALFFRLFLCIVVWLIFHAIYIYWAQADYQKYIEIGGGKIQAGAAQIEMRYQVVQFLDFYIIPCILIFFSIIQIVKRAHDVNKSGWFLLIPFYNLYLIMADGTDGNNNYGLVPHPEKKSPNYLRDEK